jgi:hypothetical protein
MDAMAPYESQKITKENTYCNNQQAFSEMLTDTEDDFVLNDLMT